MMTSKFKYITFLFIFFTCVNKKTFSQSNFILKGSSTKTSTSIDSIMKWAKSGDTIFFPQGQITAPLVNGNRRLIIDKELHLRGYSDYQKNHTKDFRTILKDPVVLNTGSKNSTIEGFYIKHSLFTNSDSFIRSITIKNNYILVLSMQGKSTKITTNRNGNIYIINNIIDRIDSDADVYPCYLYNNIITGLVNNSNFVNSTNSWFKCTFKNNLFLSWGTVKIRHSDSNYFVNCIFIPDAQTYEDYIYESKGNKFENCLSNKIRHSPWTLQNPNTIKNCYQNQKDSNTFFKSSPLNKFDSTLSYKLKPTSLGKNGGTDGKDVGIWGGDYPWQTIYKKLTGNKGNYAIKNNYYQPYFADPIQVATGTFMYSNSDINLNTFGRKLEFARFYNSYNHSTTTSMGRAWSHSFNYKLEFNLDTINIIHPDGHVAQFLRKYENPFLTFNLNNGVFDTLIQINSKTYIYKDKNSNILKFDSIGLLLEKSDLNNSKLKFLYNQQKLIKIEAVSADTGANKRSVFISYNNTNLINGITTNTGRKCSYFYDSFKNLTHFANPNGDTIYYKYKNNLLTKIIKPDLSIQLENIYDSITRKVIEQKDCYGLSTFFNYNKPSQNRVTIFNVDSTKRIFDFDESFRQTKLINEAGLSYQFYYNSNNLIDSISNPNKQGAKLKYDILGNKTIESYPENRKILTTYNHFNKPQTQTLPNGQVNSFNYDTKGNLTKIIYSDSSMKIFDYDTNGNLITYIYNKDTVKLSYNFNGDLIKKSTKNGFVTYSYDRNGNIISVINELKNEYKFKYNNSNYLIEIQDPYNQKIKYKYDKNNNLIGITDKKGLTTSIGFDLKGRKIFIENPMGERDSFFYNNRDFLIKTKDKSGFETQYEYDNIGQLTKIHNLTSVSHFVYDSVGNIVKYINPLGHVFFNKFDNQNQLIETKNSLNQIVKYNYDSLNRLTKTLNYKNYYKEFSYSLNGKINKIRDEEGIETRIEYDKNDNISKIIDGNNHIQKFEYSQTNLISRFKDADLNEYSFEYDSLLNIKSYNTPNGTIKFEYDKLNRLIKKQIDSLETIQYQYDLNNNIIKNTKNNDSTLVEYDNLNRIVKVKDKWNYTTKYRYNKAGSISSIIYPSNDSVQYQYDPSNRLIEVKDWKNNIYKYKYDSLNRVKAIEYPSGMKSEIIYDAIDRVLEKTIKTKTGKVFYQQKFEYYNDSIIELRIGLQGKEIEQDTLNNYYFLNDALINDGKRIYRNDKQGNRIKSINGIDSLIYKWTTENFLTQIYTSNDTISYEYDGFGNRISKKDSLGEKRFVNDINNGLSRVLQIKDGNGNTTSSFIYGIGLLGLIDEFDSSYYYHFDYRGNTVLLTNIIDSQLNLYSYNTFGYNTYIKENINQPFTFMGEYGVQQETIGFYYVRARYYDALQGRFLSRDEHPGVIEHPITLNKYIYGNNNPLEFIDPSGYFGEIIISIAESTMDKKFGSKLYENTNFILDISELYSKSEILKHGLNLANIYGDHKNLLYKASQISNNMKSINAHSSPVLSDINHLIDLSEFTYREFKGQNSNGDRAQWAIEKGVQIGGAKTAFYLGTLTGIPGAGIVAEATWELSYSAGEIIGEYIFNETKVGNKITDWMAKTFW